MRSDSRARLGNILLENDNNLSQENVYNEFAGHFAQWKSTFKLLAYYLSR